jgi:hypothetical protein
MRPGQARIWLLALVCAAAMSACRDNGLPDRNLPLEEARAREFRYPAYQASENNAPVAMGGRHWIRSLPVETVPARMLVQIGNAEGTPLYALRGQQAPYSRLYSPVSQDRWMTYLRLN